MLFLIPIPALAFGAVNPAAINQYRYYQSTPCWNRGQMQQYRPRIYSEQQARYYGYRTIPQMNGQYNQQMRYQQNYGDYNSGY